MEYFTGNKGKHQKNDIHLKGSSSICLTAPEASRYSTLLNISDRSTLNILASFLYSSSYEPRAVRSRVRPTSSDSMNTLHWPISNPNSDLWLSLYQGDPSSEEFSGGPFWTTPDPEPSEKFGVFSWFPSDELWEICSFVWIGWPKSKNMGAFTSLVSFEFWVETPIESKEERLSLSSVGTLGGGWGNGPACSLLKWRFAEDGPKWACLAPCMPAGMLSGTQQNGLLGLRRLLGNDGIGYCPIKGKSEGCGTRSFFLGGEKGDRWMAGMFDTTSTNHGLTCFTFWSKSGSSHATCKMFFKQHELEPTTNSQISSFKCKCRLAPLSDLINFLPQ